MAKDLEAWLALTPEEALEPELPICDPHHHLWDTPRGRYLLPDLRRDTGAGHNVVGTVFVECMAEYRQHGPETLRPVGETEFVLKACEESSRTEGAEIKAIVGFADLNLGNAVEPVLAAHLETGGERFRGIRHAAAWDASDEIRKSHTDPHSGMLLEEAFNNGVACLGRYGLLFEAWLYHTQLDELAELARRNPEVSIVLDHVGGPLGIGPYAGKRAEVFEHWRRGISAVAACPNVVVKLGGLHMPRNGFGWHQRDRPPTSAELIETTGPYLRFCIDQFGVERSMFESNFPVDKLSCSYTVLWNSFKRLTASASPSEKALLFHDTATRVYRLDS